MRAISACVSSDSRASALPSAAARFSASILGASSGQSTRSSSVAASCISTEMSWPASRFLPVSRDQAPHRSRQPRIVKRAGPGASKVTSAVQRSLPANVILISRPSDSATAAANTSCPSPNTSASIRMGWPATAFAAKRPPSMSGLTPSMAIRRAARSVRSRPACGSGIADRPPAARGIQSRSDPLRAVPSLWTTRPECRSFLSIARQACVRSFPPSGGDAASAAGVPLEVAHRTTRSKAAGRCDAMQPPGSLVGSPPVSMGVQGILYIRRADRYWAFFPCRRPKYGRPPPSRRISHT